MCFDYFKNYWISRFSLETGFYGKQKTVFNKKTISKKKILFTYKNFKLLGLVICLNLKIDYKYICTLKSNYKFIIIKKN